MRWALAALASLGCAVEPEPEALVATFEDLHRPLYGAFAAPDDDALWDLLAASWEGEALTRAYVNQHVARVAMARADQAVRVTGVDYGAVAPVAPDDAGRPRVDAEWWVRGVVRHQAHSHARVHHYRAIYTLAPTPGGWRLVDEAIFQLDRVRSTVDADVLLDDAGAAPPAARGFVDPLELLDGLERPP